MNEERLKKIKNHIEEMGVYQFTHFLDIDVKEVANENNYNYKLTNLGLNYLVSHKNFDEALIKCSFPENINEGIMQCHEYFLIKSEKAYQDLVLMLNDEKNKNMIFDKINNVFDDKGEYFSKYKTLFINFLTELIKQEKDLKIIQKNFQKVKENITHDKNDYSALLKTFIKKGINADEIFALINPLNNSYLESKLYHFVIENGIKCEFKPNEVNMFETEDKIIYESSINFNKNFFMKQAIEEKIVESNLETLFDLILSDENVYYLVTNKDKSLKLTLRSQDENLVKNLKNKIVNSSDLILEFVKGYDNKEEYKVKFLNYFRLNEAFNLSHRSSNKMKI